MGRVSLHAVSRWSRSPGCCGYNSWCIFLVSGGISFFFSFSLLRTYTAYCKYEASLIYLSTSTGVRTGCHYLISLSVYVCVCVTFIAFTDCESCTRPISTNPVSMEASAHGLMRETCFFARRLDAVSYTHLTLPTILRV